MTRQPVYDPTTGKFVFFFIKSQNSNISIKGLNGSCQPVYDTAFYDPFNKRVDVLRKLTMLILK